MTDTSAPAPSAAPAPQPAPQPAPARSEVQINQNPTNAPRPIPQQAVPAPDKGNGRASVRESLAAAFERSQSKQPAAKTERAEPKAAEAKAGHNQPPEETPRLNLKKPPDQQGEPQPRDRGRFAPREQADATNGTPNVATNQAGNVAQNNAMQGNAGTDGQPYKRLPPHAPYADPPARMAEHGKRDWADTPESVRGEVHRVQAEFGKAYQYYKDAHDAFKPVERFHQMAQQHGTTLEQALQNYTTIEQKLRADPVAGLDQIVNNLGLKDPKTGQKIGLRDIAHYVLNSSPEQLRQVQQGNQQQAAAHQIGALYNEITTLKQAMHQWQTEQQFTHVRSALDQFADTHPRLDELGVPIEQELKLGFDLETAYRRAELLYPATHAAQTRNPPAQTRQTDRSISGSPDVAPSNGASRKQKPSGSPREALENAYARLNS